MSVPDSDLFGGVLLQLFHVRFGTFEIEVRMFVVAEDLKDIIYLHLDLLAVDQFLRYGFTLLELQIILGFGVLIVGFLYVYIVSDGVVRFHLNTLK